MASLCQAFGAHPRIGAFLLEGDSVLHVVGRRAVLYRLKPRTMSFVYTPPREVLELTAMAMSPSGTHFAVCEKWNAGHETFEPKLRVVHLPAKRKGGGDDSAPLGRTVAVLESSAVEGAFEHCAFSEDGKLVVAASGAPDFVAVVWRWADEKPVGFFQLHGSASAIHFNPGAAAKLISISSPMRLMRLNENGHFREIEVGVLKRHTEGLEVVDHRWLSSSKLLIAASEADGASCALYVFQDGSLKQTISVGVVPRTLGAPASAEASPP